MNVSFADWVTNGWLVARKSSKQEIGNLLGIVVRDLKDSQAKDVSDDWRFAIAYNAALQAATAALAAAGYRASRENHHYRVIQSLELTIGKDAKFIRAFDVPQKEKCEQLRHWGRNLPSRSRRDARDCAEFAARR
jgi:hypothetical protein